MEEGFLKRKNLEKAVLLTVIMMSLHSNVQAAVQAVSENKEISTDINQETTVMDKAEASNSGIYADNGKITVIGDGKLNVITTSDLDKNNPVQAIKATGTSTIEFNNTGGTEIAVKNIGNNYIGSETVTGVLAEGNSTIKFADDSALTIDMSATKNHLDGIRIDNGSNVEIGNSGATITLSNTYLSSDVGILAGIRSEGDLTADGKITINFKGTGYDMYGISTSNESEVKINAVDINLYSSKVGDSAIGIRAYGKKFDAENLNVSVSGKYITTAMDIGNGCSMQVENNTIIRAENTYTNQSNSTPVYGVSVNDGSFQSNIVDITAIGPYGESLAVYLANDNAVVNIKEGGVIKASGGVNGNKMAAGVYAKGGEFTSAGNLIVLSRDGYNKKFGLYADGGNIAVENIDITAEGGSSRIGIFSNEGKVTVNGDAVIETKQIAAQASKQNAEVEFKNGFYAGSVTDGNPLNYDESVIARDGGKITVNSSGNGVVQFTGNTNIYLDDDYYKNGIINLNLTNNNSYWNLTDSSTLTDLVISNGAKLDMTKDYNKGAGASAKFSTLTIENLTGDDSIIYMDVDEINKISDRINITGEHSGNQEIALIPKDALINIKDVVGTVVASEKLDNNTGTFTAREEEGALFWEDYRLSKVDHTGDEGFAKDWIISGVTIDTDTPTTSVVTIMGANALNFHAWRGENGQLMRRMGELRLNGADEQGAWFRMHGSEMSRNDNAAFENKYTSYEFGYDQVTKQTDDMIRYTGAALSYTDGSSSYEHGSGENHSKAISFYNTDIYKSGHYLDLILKYAQFNNDFDVFDTHGHEISGEMKNTGISFGVEYGRKNDLNSGWFIEPQAQLTLGYFNGDEYETSNGIKVDQGGIPSILGRIGFSVGKELGSNGVIYAKASLLHEFAGDYDITMSNIYSGSISRKESASFGDTWVEYGVGAAIKTGKNNYFYFDIAQANGADFDRDWMWNAGIRWMF